MSGFKRISGDLDTLRSAFASAANAALAAEGKLSFAEKQSQKVIATLMRLMSGELMGGFLPGGMAFDYLLDILQLFERADATSINKAEKLIGFLDFAGVDSSLGGEGRNSINTALRTLKDLLGADPDVMSRAAAAGTINGEDPNARWQRLYGDTLDALAAKRAEKAAKKAAEDEKRLEELKASERAKLEEQQARNARLNDPEVRALMLREKTAVLGIQQRELESLIAQLDITTGSNRENVRKQLDELSRAMDETRAAIESLSQAADDVKEVRKVATGLEKTVNQIQQEQKRQPSLTLYMTRGLL